MGNFKDLIGTVKDGYDEYASDAVEAGISLYKIVKDGIDKDDIKDVEDMAEAVKGMANITGPNGHGAGNPVENATEGVPGGSQAVGALGMGKVKASIKINRLPKPPGTVFDSIHISQSMNGHQHFSINNYRYDNFAKIPSAVNPKIEDLVGQSVEISAGKANIVFEGIITAANQYTHPDNTVSYNLRGIGMTALLDDGLHCRIFQSKTHGEPIKLEEIVKKINEEYAEKDLAQETEGDLIFLNESAKELDILQITQYKESNFNFIFRLAATLGEWCYYDGKNIQIGLPKDQSVPGTTYIQSISTNARVTPINQIELGILDADNKAEQLSEETDDELKGISKLIKDKSKKVFGTKEAKKVIPSIHDQKDKAAYDLIMKAKYGAKMNELFHHQVSTVNSLHTLGQTFCFNMEKAKLKLLTRTAKVPDHSLTFRIVEISHYFDMEGDYTNSLKMIPDGLPYPIIDDGIYYPKGEQQIATVMPITKEDPDKLGRVKIKYDWMDDEVTEDDVPWVKVLQQYAGMKNDKPYGNIIIPEADSRVLISYEMGNIERPFVQGCFFDHKNKPCAKTYDGLKNVRKSITSLSGFTITWDDTEGEEKIVIADDIENKGNCIEITKGGVITIVGGTVEVKAKTLKLEGSDGIEMKTDGLLDMQVADLNITGSGDLLADGFGDATINASGKALLKGGSEATVDGGQTNIKGQPINLN